MIFSLLSLSLLSGPTSWSALPPCLNCGQGGLGSRLDASEALKIEESLFSPQSARVLSTIPALPKDIEQWVNHKNGQPLPNSFERPWSMGQAQIDTYRWVYNEASRGMVREILPFSPNFVTRYYEPSVGILWNSPYAPWNAVADALNVDSSRLPVSTFGVPGSFEARFPFDVSPPRVPTASKASVSLI